MTVQRRGGHVRSQGHRGGVAIGQVLRPVLVFHGRFRIASEKGRKAGDVNDPKRPLFCERSGSGLCLETRADHSRKSPYYFFWHLVTTREVMSRE